MAGVVFLDTSVLCNVLDVPRKNGERNRVMPRFNELLTDGTVLVVPIAAVIEVGNHIAQLPEGSRRTRSAVFETFLRQSLSSTPPWVVSGAAWDTSFLDDLLTGHSQRPGMVELCERGVGTGDGAILLEVERFRQRADLPSALPVELWTLDRALDAHGTLHR